MYVCDTAPRWPRPTHKKKHNVGAAIHRWCYQSVQPGNKNCSKTPEWANRKWVKVQRGHRRAGKPFVTVDSTTKSRLSAKYVSPPWIYLCRVQWGWGTRPDPCPTPPCRWRRQSKTGPRWDVPTAFSAKTSWARTFFIKNSYFQNSSVGVAYHEANLLDYFLVLLILVGQKSLE